MNRAVRKTPVASAIEKANSRSSTPGGSGRIIISTTPMMPNGTTMSHRVFLVGVMALAFTSQASRTLRAAPSSASESIDVGENARDGSEVSCWDGMPYGDLGIQRPGKRAILQDWYAARASLSPNAESDFVVSLREDHRGRISISVAQSDCNVGWIGHDDVGTLDVLQRPLLRQGPSPSSHPPLELGIALLLALILR